MFEFIIQFSVRNKLLVVVLMLALIVGGTYSMLQLPLDAVPDITNNQVQVVTICTNLAPQEVEQFVTAPLERNLSNLPRVVEVRSISRFGLSVITLVFEEDTPTLEARQLVSEQLSVAASDIPPGMGTPELMPITTGLGEIYQYVLTVKPGFKSKYNPMELRTIQDWIIKRQFAGTKGIIEVSSFGGYMKQYEVSVDPILLQAANISLEDVHLALSAQNQNSGSSYIEKDRKSYYIRALGMIENAQEILSIPISTQSGTPLKIGDIATVELGAAKRFGSMSMDGKGEVVGGITLMLKGANSSEAIQSVHERVNEIQKSLPEGVEIYPYLDRSVLVGKTINTVVKNLVEGGLIVIFVLVLMLGNFRAGWIVASVIPLSMLFALILMNYFGVSANLMSLGAIDFGIVVDGAVIIVEGVLHHFHHKYRGKTIDNDTFETEVIHTSASIYRSAAFGVFIIIVVFLPIMTLSGIEGKMFRPMALTVSFAILGSLLLSLTYVPVMASLFLSKKIPETPSKIDAIMDGIAEGFGSSLAWILKRKTIVLSLCGLLLVGASVQFLRMGGEFIPTLEEGDLAMQMSVPPGSSLSESLKMAQKAESILLKNFPEVKHVVTKTGTSEVPTDPMAVEDSDVMILMKEKDEWVSANNREELIQKMEEALSVIKGVSFEFTQPIQLRFNELLTGAKTDIAIRIFGEDPATLKAKGDEVQLLVQHIEGVGDCKVEQTEGLKQWVVRYRREKMYEYGLQIEEANRVLRAAYGGENAGVIYEGERNFELVVRLKASERAQLDLSQLYLRNSSGQLIPFSEFSWKEEQIGPMQISRETSRRKISIGINVRNRDIASLVAEIQQTLDQKLKLPAGYSISYGGQFENMEKAQKRLLIAVPLALAMIFMLLYLTFNSVTYAALIFTAVPFSAVGGIAALTLKGLPFSISAGVGFIALFGVSVLNGIVLISYLNRLKEEGISSIEERILTGVKARFRPVIMTATVASLGFIPMALSTSNGAEVQIPLAIVVIGGLISSTLLTLYVLPILYALFESKSKIPVSKGLVVILLGLGCMSVSTESNAQTVISEQEWVRLWRENAMESTQLKMRSEAYSEWENQVSIWNPIQIDNQTGQINEKVTDAYFSVMLSTNGLFQSGAKKSLAKHSLEEWKANEVQSIEFQVFEWKKRYLEWQLIQEKGVLLDKLNEHMMRLQERIDAQGKTGYLDPVVSDLSSLQSNFWIVEKNKQFIALQQLKRLFISQWEGADSTWVPEPLKYEEVISADSISSTSLWLAAGNHSINKWNATIKDAKLSRLPDVNAGFFRQSINKVGGFQGFFLGLSIPLQSGVAHSKIKEAKKLVDAERQRNAALRFRMQTQLGLLKTESIQWQALQKQVNSNGWDDLLSRSKAQLEAGLLTIPLHLQNLKDAYQAQLQHLEIIHASKLNAIEQAYLLSTPSNEK